MLNKKLQEINLSKRGYFIGAAALLILIVLAIVLGRKDDSALVRGIVSVGDVDSVISLSGKVESSKDVSLRFSTSGTVSGVNVKIGQVVRDGERLVSLSSGSLEADLLRARANLDLIKAESKVLNAGLDRAVESAYVELLNNDLQTYPREREKDYSVTPPVVIGSYLDKKENLYNLEVYGSSAPSGTSFRYFGIDESGAEAINQHALSELGESGLYLQFDTSGNYRNTNWVIPIPNSRSSTYSLYLNKYKNALASRDAAESSNISLDIANAKIKQAEAEIVRIQADLNERSIRAPFNGTISFVGVQKGEIASQSDIAVSLISKDNYEVKIQIPEVDLSKINKDQIARIKIDAYPGEEFEGVIASVDPAETIVEGVSVYEAIVYFNNQDPRIRSGMTASVDILSAKKESVLRVQKQFIERDQMGEFVFLYLNGEQVKSYISTGISSSDGFVEIVGGLSEGDIVIGNFK